MSTRKNKAAASTLAVLLFSGAALAGCGGNEGGSKHADSGQSSPASSPNASSPSSAPKTPVKLEITMGDASKLPDADFIKQELDKKLGTDIAMTLVGAEYQNQLNVRIASSNFPDLFVLADRTNMQQLADKGVLLDLTPYADKLGEYKKFIGEDQWKKGQWNGKMYALPKTSGIASGTYWVRKDWLDKLQLQPPATLEELLNVAKAFTEKDPDGNGKKDTLGITGPGLTAFGPIFGAYGVTNGFAGFNNNGGEFFVKDGKLSTVYDDPAMKDALAEVKAFIDAGVVDPEIMSNKGTMIEDKAYKGQFGIVYTSWTVMAKDDRVKIIKEANPNAEWLQLSAPKGPTGLQNNGFFNIGTSGAMWGIPKTLEKNPEKLNKIFELINYVSSKEGNLLVQFGLKDKHFTVDGDKVTFTELGAKEAGYSYLYQYTGRPETEYLKTKFAKQAPYIDFEAKQPRIQSLSGFVDLPKDFNKADADRFVEEEISKFIYGKTPLGDYDKFVKQLDGTFKFKAYKDEAEKQLKALGFVK